MHATLSHGEFQRVGQYVNCLLSCSCIISPDLGLPTQVQRAEHLPVQNYFIWRGLKFFLKSFSLIDSENNSPTDKN